MSEVYVTRLTEAARAPCKDLHLVRREKSLPIPLLRVVGFVHRACITAHPASFVARPQTRTSGGVSAALFDFERIAFMEWGGGFLLGNHRNDRRQGGQE